MWVVVLAAAGEKAFCVGADLKERASFSLDDFYANRGHMKAMFEAVRAIPQPTIASIFGFALGGGFELALSCDLIVAAEGTQVRPARGAGGPSAGRGRHAAADPEGRTGTREGADLHRRASRTSAAVGHGADPGDRSLRLLARSHDASGGADHCRRPRSRCAKRKHAIDASVGIPLEEGIEIEHEAWARVIASDDRAEGIAAFNEKRDRQNGRTGDLPEGDNRPGGRAPRRHPEREGRRRDRTTRSG